MRRSTESTLIGIAIIIALIIVVPAAKFALGFYNEDHITATVTDKERVNKDQSSYNLVFTDKEVFTVQDSLIKWQWHSSDIYGKIEIGKTYNFTVFGWRNGFMSWYKNIIEFEEA